MSVRKIHSHDREAAAQLCALRAQALMFETPLEEVPEADAVPMRIARVAYDVVKSLGDALYGLNTHRSSYNKAMWWLEAEALIRTGWTFDDQVEMWRCAIANRSPTWNWADVQDETMRHDETRLIDDRPVDPPLGEPATPDALDFWSQVNEALKPAINGVEQDFEKKS